MERLFRSILSSFVSIYFSVRKYGTFPFFSLVQNEIESGELWTRATALGDVDPGGCSLLLPRG